MTRTTVDQLETIRTLLDRAETTRDRDTQIGSLLIAISNLTDLVEAQGRRIADLEQRNGRSDADDD